MHLSGSEVKISGVRRQEEGEPHENKKAGMLQAFRPHDKFLCQAGGRGSCRENRISWRDDLGHVAGMPQVGLLPVPITILGMISQLDLLSLQ